MAETATLVVGRVRRPHGVRGELVVEVTSDVPGRFLSGEKLDLVETGGDRRSLEIVSTRVHQGCLLVRFRGIEDRDTAESVRGASLEITADRSPEAPDGWYYYHQLVGCVCRDAARGALGVVDEVIEDGGGLLLSLVDRDRVLLVPFVEDFIQRIDLDTRTIEFDLPEGLLESCVSPS